MLKENQKVIAKWSGRNKGYYISKGYIYTKIGDLFDVNVEDLSSGTRSEVIVVCDYCLENGIHKEFKKPYFKYVKQRLIIEKDCCIDCRDVKQREVMVKKYGVTSAVQLDRNKSTLADSKRLDFKVIESHFENTNCTLLTVSDQYSNNIQPLEFTCNIHSEKGIQSRTWTSIQSSKNNNICIHCINEKKWDNKRHDFEKVRIEFEKKGYTLLPNQEYVNSKSKLKFVCKEHPDEIHEASYSKSHSNKHNCNSCYQDTISGENAMFWKGGITPQIKKDRTSGKYYNWRRNVFERDSYTCRCCEEKGGKLNAHHIENFSNNLSLRYEVYNGITLCEKCHLQTSVGSFHYIYGTQDNDIFELQEYFDEIRSSLGLPLVDIESIIYKDYIFKKVI